MKERRIIDLTQRTPAEEAKSKRENPYYRHLEDKISRENLRLATSDLTEKQIEERWDLMELLAPNEWEKEVIRNFRHQSIRKGSVGK